MAPAVQQRTVDGSLCCDRGLRCKCVFRCASGDKSDPLRYWRGHRGDNSSRSFRAAGLCRCCPAMFAKRARYLSRSASSASVAQFCARVVDPGVGARRRPRAAAAALQSIATQPHSR
eukprot:5929189-Pyramimonas_sp.AAC.1